ncbi:MAG: Mth938-like domain-containing protein [Desulfococcaceae bacterium]
MIEDYSFGKIVADGEKYHKDICIVRGKVIPDWRRKKGHSVCPEDIRDILDAEPEILIIGTGYFGMMSTDAVCRELLARKGIVLREEKSGSAVKTFNRLVTEGKNVAAGFHLTC